MATLWTLLAGGVEKTLADWGLLDDFEANFANKGKGCVSFNTNERFDPAALQFTSFPAWFRANPTGSPISQLVTMYRDRTSVGSGGTIYFQGFFDDPRREISGGEEHVTYQLYDVLWLFERNPFKQHYKQFTGWATPGDPSSGPVYVDKVCPEIFLGEKADGSHWTNGEQIAEVIAWMNESYNPTRRGASSGMDATKDVVTAGTINPKALTPITRVNTIFCIEAINNVLRWCPDAVFKVDHTTMPPTLHVLTMGKWNYATDPPTFIDYTNLPEVTIDITAQQEKEIQLQTQVARQLPGVIIYYRTSATVDSLVVPILTRDAYPTSISDFYPEAASHLVELAGSKLMHVTADVLVGPLPVADAVTGDDDARAEWWIAHNKALNDPLIDEGTIFALEATVKDDSGAPVDLSAYPNEVLNPIPKWVKDNFGVSVIRAHVRAYVKYLRYADETLLIADTSKDGQWVTRSLKLTNAITQTYKAVKSADTGESVAAGVAESVYRGAALAQNAGRITFRDDQLRSDIYIGCRLKLVGPNTTFSNVLPQAIRARPCAGTTTVQFGPSAIVDADALIELARATRLRFLYNMPSGRSDGFGSGGDEVDDTMDSPTEDTAFGVGGEKLSAVTFKREV